MKTLNTYVTRGFLAIFAMAIGILTFCLIGGRAFKEVLPKLSEGVPLSDAALCLWYFLPTVLCLTIPWALLVSIMLLFGRLSADNEITAMRACGVSILQIISPLIIFTFILTCFCVYLQVDLAPRYFKKAESILKDVVVNHPLALIEPGIPRPFENSFIYVRDKYDENKIKDIQIYNMDKKMEHVTEDISAASGIIEVDTEKELMFIKLNNATIVRYERSKDDEDNKDDKDDEDKISTMRTFSKEFSFEINYGERFNKKEITTRVKRLSVSEIFGRIALSKKLNLDTTRLEVQLNLRLAMAFMPIAFLMLGMPLAIRTSRRETSAGLFLSVILAGIYFGFVMICSSLYSKPQLYPQVLLWLPCILYQVLGVLFITRIARR